jgi:hypothetical protein
MKSYSIVRVDKTYIDIMVKDHETMMNTFQAEAAKVTDPQLKDFIANVEPVVAHHLAMAKASGRKDRELRNGRNAATHSFAFWYASVRMRMKRAPGAEIIPILRLLRAECKLAMIRCHECAIRKS